jgi:Fe-S-cluster containining protein
MDCRACGVCCTEISISSPIPGMPSGKPAGVPCVNLNGKLCSIFEHPSRPRVCSSFKASEDICGQSDEDAVRLIRFYEKATV